MAKPKTKTKTINKGTELRIAVEGQTGTAVCTAGALEAGNFTNWTPQMLDAGIKFRPKQACTIEFLSDFLTATASDLAVTVAAGTKSPTTWTVKRADGPRQSWQLWISVK